MRKTYFLKSKVLGDSLTVRFTVEHGMVQVCFHPHGDHAPLPYSGFTHQFYSLVHYPLTLGRGEWKYLTILGYEPCEAPPELVEYTHEQ
jgi:hypothetical protein